MLIRNAELWQRGIGDLRIADGIIADIGKLEARPEEQVIEAHGGALLPGLHDHHIHLAASAVRGQSVVCGPPEVTNADELAARLAGPGDGWLRGILYHESVMGLPNAGELDRLAPHRPVRIQHRSGRMWLLNSPALDLLLAEVSPPPGLERVDGRFTGHLFDEDAWLQSALGSQPPSLRDISRELAQYGVTGVTDMSPRNDAAFAAHIESEVSCGSLVQRCMVAGTLSLANVPLTARYCIGPAKLHLHENAMPDFDETVAFICAAHAQGRPLASHCTTETELVFTLAALESASVLPGDRIEHAGIARDLHVAEIARLGLAVVSQPHFVAERGDQYLRDVEPELHHALYRLGSFRDAGIVLAGGSDAPFGSPNPWAAMAAAVSRSTGNNMIIGENEALTPEQAVALYLSDPADLGTQRKVEIGESTDLCLLDRPWNQARENFSSQHVTATFVAGRIVHQGIDQPPV